MFCIHSKLSFLWEATTADCYILPDIWFQVSGRTSETLARGFWYPAEGLNLDLKTCPHILIRGSWNQKSGRGFHQISSLNWLIRRKLILSIYINRLLYRVWYLNFRCLAAHLKLSTEVDGGRRRILVPGWRFEPRF